MFEPEFMPKLTVVVEPTRTLLKTSNADLMLVLQGKSNDNVF